MTQVQTHAARDISDVVLALAQVFVFDACQQLSELLIGPVHCPRRIDLLLPDDLLRAANKQRVVEHQLLRVENGGELGTACLGYAVADVVQLLAGQLARRVQRGNLTVDPCGRDLESNGLGPQGQDHCAADGHAG